MRISTDVLLETLKSAGVTSVIEVEGGFRAKGPMPDGSSTEWTRRALAALAELKLPIHLLRWGGSDWASPGEAEFESKMAWMRFNIL